jgi:hypothetical protein
MTPDKPYNYNKLPIGLLIRDGDRIGFIYREIKSGTWSEYALFNWKINYEIYYDDGSVCIMGSETIKRLIKSGKIEIIGEKK